MSNRIRQEEGTPMTTEIAVPEVLESEYGDLWIVGHHEPKACALAVALYACDPEWWGLTRPEAFDLANRATFEPGWYKPQDDDDEGSLFVMTHSADPAGTAFMKVIPSA